MGGLHLLNAVLHARQHIKHWSAAAKHGASSCRSGHFVVYVGDDEEQGRKRFVVPISYLKHPLFKDLLNKAAEEFGFDHVGGLTVPCDEKDFIDLTSRISKSSKSKE
ncbi:auxin-responsive protein SAUR21 [Ziziphus jujuba]|uniref:Auxin-responsive protein SAUR21 n=1 Tax=Ziziphus jujuba TaxID=326968 RepID=A0A6P4AVT7_ZIZJJ|nr:auxin-responsive protein SAUR21 [Ziziphus jujuba]